MSRRRDYIKSCQVSEKKVYTLNGYPQQVLLEGKSKTSPIIIFLHGGPGTPMPFCAGSRGLFPEITDRFIMVYWDQLGCGINDYVIDDGFSIDSFVKMTVDLIKAVRNDFPDNPINIFGVSWGSVLAAKAAAQVPELLNRVVVYGQVLSNLFFNDEVYAALDKAKLSKKDAERLAHLKSADIIEQNEIRIMAGLIRRYTEGYQSKSGGKTPMGKIIFGLLTGPDYRLRDFKAVMVNGTIKNKSLLRELIHLDMRSTLESVAIPYFIIQGDKDIVTSTRFIESFVKESKNGNLNCVVIKDSGHMPSGKAMDYILQTGLDTLK